MRPGREGGDGLLGLVGADPPRLPHLVQGPGVLHEPVATLDEGPLDGSGVGILRRAATLERGTELLGEPSLVARPVVGVEDEVREPDAREAGEHRVDGGALLGHEEDPFALSCKGGDEVGDGLGLAGAGRALDHEVGTAAHGVDGRLLGGVRIEDEVLAGGVGVGRAFRHVGAHCPQRARVARRAATTSWSARDAP